MGRIHIASRQGDLEEVKELLAEKPQLLNTLDNEFNTPLVSATIFGHLNIVKYIIENFGKLYLNYKYYPTGSVINSIRGSTEINSTSDQGVSLGNTQDYKDEIISSFQGRINSNGATNSMQMKAFHFESKSPESKVIALTQNIIEDAVLNQSQIEEKDLQVQREHGEGMFELESNERKVTDEEEGKGDIECTNEQAKRNQTSDSLLSKDQHNMDITPIGEHRNSVLLAACTAARVKIVEYLLHECNVEVNFTNEKGESALILAAQRNHLDVVNLLLNHNADITILTKENVGVSSILQISSHGNDLPLPTSSNEGIKSPTKKSKIEKTRDILLQNIEANPYAQVFHYVSISDIENLKRVFLSLSNDQDPYHAELKSQIDPLKVLEKRNSQFSSPLIHASRLGHKNIFVYLINLAKDELGRIENKTGVPVDKKEYWYNILCSSDNQGGSILSYSALCENTSLIEYILEIIIENIIDKGKWDEVEYLNNDPNSIENKYLRWINSAFSSAQRSILNIVMSSKILSTNEQLIELLLKCKCSASRPDFLGKTPYSECTNATIRHLLRLHLLKEVKLENFIDLSSFRVEFYHLHEQKFLTRTTAEDSFRNLNALFAQQYIMRGGYLAKKGGVKTKLFGRLNWKVRYFLLDGHYLSYHKQYDSLPTTYKETITNQLSLRNQTLQEVAFTGGKSRLDFELNINEASQLIENENIENDEIKIEEEASSTNIRAIARPPSPSSSNGKSATNLGKSIKRTVLDLRGCSCEIREDKNLDGEDFAFAFSLTAIEIPINLMNNNGSSPSKTKKKTIIMRAPKWEDREAWMDVFVLASKI